MITFPTVYFTPAYCALSILFLQGHVSADRNFSDLMKECTTDFCICSQTYDNDVKDDFVMCPWHVNGLPDDQDSTKVQIKAVDGPNALCVYVDDFKSSSTDAVIRTATSEDVGKSFFTIRYDYASYQPSTSEAKVITNEDVDVTTIYVYRKEFFYDNGVSFSFFWPNDLITCPIDSDPEPNVPEPNDPETEPNDPETDDSSSCENIGNYFLGLLLLVTANFFIVS